MEGMSRLFLDLLHELKPHVLQSGMGTFVALKAHKKVLVPEIFTQIVPPSSCCMRLKPLEKPILVHKN